MQDRDRLQFLDHTNSVQSKSGNKLKEQPRLFEVRPVSRLFNLARAPWIRRLDSSSITHLDSRKFTTRRTSRNGTPGTRIQSLFKFSSQFHRFVQRFGILFFFLLKDSAILSVRFGNIPGGSIDENPRTQMGECASLARLQSFSEFLSDRPRQLHPE